MAKVVGVRFRNVGKIYYFNPKTYKIKPGDHVIVETARGVEYGKVVLAPKEVAEDEVVHLSCVSKGKVFLNGEVRSGSTKWILVKASDV